MKLWKIMALSLSVLGVTLPVAAIREKDLLDAQRMAIRRGVREPNAALAIGPYSSAFLQLRETQGDSGNAIEACYLNLSSSESTDFSNEETPPDAPEGPLSLRTLMKEGDTALLDTEKLHQPNFLFRHVYLDLEEIGENASDTFRALAQIMSQDGCLHLLRVDDFDPNVAQSSVTIPLDKLLGDINPDNLSEVWKALQKLKKLSGPSHLFTYEEALPTFSLFLNGYLRSFFQHIEKNGSRLTLSGFILHSEPSAPLPEANEEEEDRDLAGEDPLRLAELSYSALHEEAPYRGSLSRDPNGNVRVTCAPGFLPGNILQVGHYLRNEEDVSGVSFLITSIDPASSSFTIAQPAILPLALRDWSQPLNFSVSYNDPSPRSFSPFIVDFTDNAFYRGLVGPSAMERPKGATVGLLIKPCPYSDEREFYLFEDGQWVLRPFIEKNRWGALLGTQILWLGGPPFQPKDLKEPLRIEGRKKGEYRNIGVERDGRTSVKIFLREALTAPINLGDRVQLNTRDGMGQALRPAGRRKIAAIEDRTAEDSGLTLYLTGPLERNDTQNLAGIRIMPPREEDKEALSVVDLTQEQDGWVQGHQQAGQAEDGTPLTKSLFFKSPITQDLLVPGTSILSKTNSETPTKIVRVEEHGPYMHVIYSGPRLSSLEHPDMVIAHQFGLRGTIEEGHLEILVRPNPLGAPQEGRLVISGKDETPLGIVVALAGDADTGWKLFLEQPSAYPEELAELAPGPLRLVSSPLSRAAINYSRAGWHKGWQPLPDTPTKSKRFFIPFSKENEDAFKPGAILVFSEDNVVSIEAIDTNAEKTFIYVYTKQPVDLTKIDEKPWFNIISHPGDDEALLLSFTSHEGYATAQVSSDRDWKKFIGHSLEFRGSYVSFPIIKATESSEGWSLTLGCPPSYKGRDSQTDHLMLANVDISFWHSKMALDFSSEAEGYYRGWKYSQEDRTTSTHFLLPNTVANLEKFVPGQTLSLDGESFSQILTVQIVEGLMHVHLDTPIDISNLHNHNAFDESAFDEPLY